MEQLWNDERIKKETSIEDPRRGDVVAKLKKMRDEYETRIAQLETELIACQSQLAATEMFK